MLRRNEHDGRCYKETRHLRNEQTRCPLTGGEPSYTKIAQRHSSRGWTAFPSSCFPPGERSREATTWRRTEGEAGSPRVADRSGSLALLPSSPPVLHQRYTTTRTKRQVRCFPAKVSWGMKGAKKGIQMH